VVGDALAEPPGPLSTRGSIMVIVGPEGGLTARERASLADAGARPICVCPYRLRSETAAVVLLSVALGQGAVNES